jgi:hypothetical protein
MKALIATNFTAAFVLLIATACGRAAQPTLSFDAVYTAAAETLQAMSSATSLPASPTPTSTSLPTATATFTLAPTKTSLPSATRINFARGATEAVVDATVQASQTLTYVAGAAKDQIMMVTLGTASAGATLSVFGADGTLLLSPTQQGNWQGLLPSTQDYYFRITGGGSEQNFNLNIIIAARIKFDAGQTSIKLSGTTVGGYAVTYVAYALKGQKLNVTVDTNPDDAALTIYGFSDGQPYARAQNGVTDFSMTLPSTQDYIIEVVPQGGRVIDYNLTIKIK